MIKGLSDFSNFLVWGVGASYFFDLAYQVKIFKVYISITGSEVLVMVVLIQEIMFQGSFEICW